MSSAFYKRQLRTTRDNLADYKKRKSQLEDIRNSYSAFDGCAADLNQYCSSASYHIQCGIVISGGSNDSGSLFSGRDSGSGDGNISSSRNWINSEIRRVQDKIDELNRSVNRLNTTIALEEQREREERAERENSWYW